jgi:hypothetical protein
MMVLALIKYKSWTAVEFTLRDASWIYPRNTTGSAAHGIKWSSTQATTQLATYILVIQHEGATSGIKWSSAQVATELAPYRVLMGVIEYTMSKYT